jgi:uncharacterized protein (TIGR02996 family)
MPQEQDFIRAAIEQPDDDQLRLVFADWLEEQGTPVSVARAAFVRLQVRRAWLPVEHADRPALVAEESKLLARHGRKWNGPIHRMLHEQGLKNAVASRRGLIRSWHHHRGMIGRLRVRAEALDVAAELLFSLGPICWLEITGWTGTNPLPIPEAALSRLRLVRISGLGARPTPAVLQVLAHLRTVPILHLCGGSFSGRMLQPTLAFVRQHKRDQVILFGTDAGSAVIDPGGKWLKLAWWHSIMTGKWLKPAVYQAAT